MKKFFMCCAMMAAMSGGAMAQSLENSTFDGNWVNCYPWEGNKKSSEAQGTQPSGWCIANVRGIGGLGATTVGKEGTGRVGSGKSVVLTNTPNPFRASEIVPGYMTLGTAWATANASLFGVSDADGGSFGGISFVYHPDAIHFYFKRAHNVDNAKKVVNTSERASIIAYTWKGTWTQEDVPQTTAMGAPTKYDMTDRDRNVLFNASGTVGGNISKTDDAELISSIEYYIEGDYSEWQELTVPFTYKSSSTPEKLNIIIGAEDYFADRSGIGNGNQITVDDITLLYYSELASGSFNGTPLTINADGTIEDVKDIYSEDKISLTSNGHGATIEKSYDEKTAILTVTVKGEDISENADNFHTYTIQFKKPLAKGDVNGDGQVTIADVTALVNIILGKSEDEFGMANVNGDESVTIADVTALVNIILGK